MEHPQLKPYQLKPQTLEQVEIIKCSNKPTFDTSMESLELEIAEFEYEHDRTPSPETIRTQTSNP